MQAGIRNRFFAILDKDAEGFREESEDHTTLTTWDVYHIENYLLHPPSIHAAVESIAGKPLFANDAALLDALRTSAEQIIDRLVLQEIQADVNRELVNAIAFGAPPDSNDIPNDLVPSIEGSVSRVAERGGNYSAEALQERVEALRSEFEEDLADNKWMSRFPGREILKRFVSEHLTCDYETLRNVVVDKMVLESYEPESMRSVLDEILSATHEGI